MMTPDHIDRAVDMAYHIGAGTFDVSALSARDLWAFIRSEREAAATWRPRCARLSQIIEDRVRSCEDRLTELLESSE